MEGKLRVSSSPHIVTPRTTTKIMLDVLIALMPAAAVGVYMFGLRALYILIASVASAIITEYAIIRIFNRPGKIIDLSAAVTGLLLGMNLPASAPIWLPVLGSMFAVIVVKHAFGGLGHNFMNPALAGRAFLVACWPARMLGSAFIPSRTITGIASASSTVVDATSYATPLAYMKTGSLALPDSLLSLFIGNVGGCIGEVSAAALLLGGIYLIVKKVINWRIPVIYIGTVFVGVLVFKGFDVVLSLAHILAGGLFIGAFFMATDYASSPITKTGKIIFALGCGIMTLVIRLYGGYPEGVSYSILFMNVAAPLIERYTRPRVFGKVAKNA